MRQTAFMGLLTAALAAFAAKADCPPGLEFSANQNKCVPPAPAPSPNDCPASVTTPSQLLPNIGPWQVGMPTYRWWISSVAIYAGPTSDTLICFYSNSAHVPFIIDAQRTVPHGSCSVARSGKTFDCH